MVLRVIVWLTWKWLLRPLFTTNRTPSICKGNTSGTKISASAKAHFKMTISCYYNTMIFLNHWKHKKTNVHQSDSMRCSLSPPNHFLTFTLAVTLLICPRVWKWRRWICCLLARSRCLRDGWNWEHSEPWRDRQQPWDPLAGSSCSWGRVGGGGSQYTAHIQTGRLGKTFNTHQREWLSKHWYFACNHTTYLISSIKCMQFSIT